MKCAHLGGDFATLHQLATSLYPVATAAVSCLLLFCFMDLSFTSSYRCLYKPSTYNTYTYSLAIGIDYPIVIIYTSYTMCVTGVDYHNR